jgi:hypothetical protein
LPPGVLTTNKPVVAATGTVVEIWLSLFTVKTAGVPLKVTLVAPVNPVPAITTAVPDIPLEGVTVARVGTGEGLTVKFVALETVPPAAVTVIAPVVALLGTTAVIWVGEGTLKVVADTPANLTPDTPKKLVPVKVTVVPITPPFGVKLVKVGDGGRGAAAMASLAITIPDPETSSTPTA